VKGLERRWKIFGVLKLDEIDNGEGRDDEGEWPLLEEGKATTVGGKIERKWW